MTTVVRQCDFVMYLGFIAPPEQCEEDALPGSHFCSRHECDEYWGDWDDPGYWDD